MKSSITTLCFTVLLIVSCSSPEKKEEKIIPEDISTIGILSQPKTDSVITDSVFQLVSTEVSSFDENNPRSYFVLANYFAAAIPPNATDAPQVIDSTCAILIYPTDEQISKLEEKLGDDFATVTDDNGYYHGMAIEMLDSIDIETVYAEKSLLEFKSSSQSWTLDIRKEGAPEWNLIFFSLGKEPVIVPALELTHDHIKEYFHDTHEN